MWFAPFEPMWVQICLLYHIEGVVIVQMYYLFIVCSVVSHDHGCGLSPEHRDPPSLWEESCVVREAESVRSHEIFRGEFFFLFLCVYAQV